MKHLGDIRHILYINLEDRPDRREQVEHELSGFAWGGAPVRFPALRDPVHGASALGCTRSHLACLERAVHEGWDHVLIVEDDIQFLRTAVFVSRLERLLAAASATGGWDVVLLAGNNMWPFEEVRAAGKVGDEFVSVRVRHCLTTTGYLVAGAYLPTLVENVRAGLARLEREPERTQDYAIDTFWIRLQERDRWFLVAPCTVVQRAGHSDVQGRRVDFRQYMVNHRKGYAAGAGVDERRSNA
jgi:GR25 family glycosyltransferase involved in LPS biosynthesis